MCGGGGNLLKSIANPILPGLPIGSIPGIGKNIPNLDPTANPQVPNVYAPSWQNDQNAIQNATNNINSNQQNLRSSTGQSFNDEQAGLSANNANEFNNVNALQNNQQQMIQDLINKQLGDETKNLTTGSEGVGLRNFYNNLGLSPDSGAFQSSLAQRFGDVAQQGQNQLLQQGITNEGNLSKIMQGGADQQAQLLGQRQQGMNAVDQNTANLLNQLTGGSLQRQFGLEDSQTNIDLQRALAKFGGQQQKQSDILGGIGQLGGGFLSSLPFL